MQQKMMEVLAFRLAAFFTRNSHLDGQKLLGSKINYIMSSAFFSGGTRTPKHFVNLTEESKNFKMLEFPLNQLETYNACLCDLCSLTAFSIFFFSDLNYKVVIFLSHTDSIPKHFFF
jgi:hypothetical protein